MASSSSSAAAATPTAVPSILDDEAMYAIEHPDASLMGRIKAEMKKAADATDPAVLDALIARVHVECPPEQRLVVIIYALEAAIRLKRRPIHAGIKAGIRGVASWRLVIKLALIVIQNGPIDWSFAAVAEHVTPLFVSYIGAGGDIDDISFGVTLRALVSQPVHMALLTAGVAHLVSTYEGDGSEAVLAAEWNAEVLVAAKKHAELQAAAVEDALRGAFTQGVDARPFARMIEAFALHGRPYADGAPRVPDAAEAMEIDDDAATAAAAAATAASSSSSSQHQRKRGGEDLDRWHGAADWLARPSNAATLRSDRAVLDAAFARMPGARRREVAAMARRVVDAVDATTRSFVVVADETFLARDREYYASVAARDTSGGPDDDDDDDDQGDTKRQKRSNARMRR